MHRRMRIVRTLVIVGVVLLTLRLACVQLVWGPELAAQAQNQRTREYTDFARRGTVTDRDGAQLAYTMQARSLTVAPLVLRREIQERHDIAVDSGDPEQIEKFPPVEDVLDEMANVIPQMVRESGASAQKVKPDEILRKLKADNSYTVLVRNVDPDVAVEIAERFPGVAADRQDIRQYPNGAIAENVIGKISIDGEGQFGLEASSDGVLSGINGKSTEDVSTNGQIIPGTLRDQVPVVHGSDIELTLDLDLQTYVQQQLEQAKQNSLAKSASAVVLDSTTGEVLAMANTDTIDPTGDIERQLAKGRFFGNPAVQAPFEPGSVAKIITASAAIEDGVTTPDEVLQVPGSIDMAGVTVKDAWPHGVVPFTTTGVFGKSSNVGTLMLADRVGQDRFAEMLDRFGVGRYTGIELPGESPGLLLDRSQWSGGTFANLPIGQGMSLTLLQMAGVYQAVANDGERIQPRIIRSVTTPDGEVIEQPEPERIRVVSPETARTVRGMFQAVTQRDPSGVQQGTGPQAAIEGYRIAGKTGTAQQVNPDCNCYSNSDYWITFAGIAPADDPRFVIALMLDDPERGVHGEGGQSAAPLFHDIAAWLLNRDNVPLSPPREGDLILQAQ
ncbi:penicillin-binding protein 2 [Corynebacterium sp. CCM 8835]|uniref:Penicillin-binding protein 2 n=1 Tax=Corynebacterium antarcticum TaxID=2800405 RepID=A0A9Q4CBN0_9CORY|nr:penicillin-binding protein 2 [Corynebacterium antarcticum]MCK7641803.1 penicillin-binding protein 2 [Corynebacterium antarcticum]MCK7660101.1 penicillin-binding protein 2 [Corynebacterium antarcticum]MCL0245032.1 penicillin-binding protein 2 [Corynebacterium antarcticum]MCX7491406.1 penicillin-binding protein 2 [Corynebacterium antarcticum]MCX7537425.1 penicillin-binding protein 2 [Corynebacterium antarcticum]